MNSIKDKIKNILLSNFPSIHVTVYLDDGYIVYSINNKDVYYSQEYLMLVTDINCNILYPRGIYNTLFVCDEQAQNKPLRLRLSRVILSNEVRCISPL